MSGLLGDLSPEALSSMSFDDLMLLRDKVGGDKRLQALIAPYEHQAFAREKVRGNKALAPAYAAMVPGYQLAKLLRLTPTDEKSTPASLDQLLAGYRGIGQGLLGR